MAQIDTLAETILEKLRAVSQAETVIGKPILSGSTTVIPVNRVSMGFALGGKKDDASVSGGGVSINPVAFVVISENDVRVMPISKDNSIVSKVADLVPDVLSAFKGKSKADEA
jgi:uncharacterized spore protein YtfJ